MTCIKVFSCFQNTYTYCIKCETFRSALLPEIYLPSDMKLRQSLISVQCGTSLGKIQVIAHAVYKSLYVKSIQVTPQFFFIFCFFMITLLFIYYLFYLYITVASQGSLVASTQTQLQFSFRSFRKHQRASERSDTPAVLFFITRARRTLKRKQRVCEQARPSGTGHRFQQINNKSSYCYDCSFHGECCLPLSLPLNTAAPHRSPGSLYTGFPLKAKCFEIRQHVEKIKEGGGVHQPPLLYHGRDMTLRIRPRVDCCLNIYPTCIQVYVQQLFPNSFVPLLPLSFRHAGAQLNQGVLKEQKCFIQRF